MITQKALDTGYDPNTRDQTQGLNLYHVERLEDAVSTDTNMPGKFARTIPTSIDTERLKEVQGQSNGDPRYVHMGTDIGVVASPNGYHVAENAEAAEFEKLFSELIEALGATSPVQAKVMKMMYGEGVFRTGKEAAGYLNMTTSAVHQAKNRALKRIRANEWGKKFAPFYFARGN